MSVPCGYIEVHQWFRWMFCLNPSSERISQTSGKQVILCIVNIVKSSNTVFSMFTKEPKSEWNCCHNTGSFEVNLPPVQVHFPFHGWSLALDKGKQHKYCMKITELCMVRSVFHVTWQFFFLSWIVWSLDNLSWFYHALDVLLKWYSETVS